MLDVNPLSLSLNDPSKLDLTILYPCQVPCLSQHGLSLFLNVVFTAFQNLLPTASSASFFTDFQFAFPSSLTPKLLAISHT